MSEPIQESLESEIAKIFSDFRFLLLKPIDKLEAECLARVRSKQNPEQSIIEEIKEGTI